MMSERSRWYRLRKEWNAITDTAKLPFEEWLADRIAELEALAVRAYKAGWNDGIHNKGWTDSEVRQRVAALQQGNDDGK